MTLPVAFLILFLFLLLSAGFLAMALFVIHFAGRWFLRFFRIVLSSTPVERCFSSHPGAVAFVKARLSPAERLGLHLVVGLLASIVFASFFVEIAEEVKEAEAVALADEAVLDIVFRLHNPFLIDFFVVITYLGSWKAVAAGSVFLVGALLAFRKLGLLFGYIVTVSAGGILNGVLKAVYARSRPLYEGVIVEASGWSFPSGHAMNAVIFYGVAVYLLLVLPTSGAVRLAGAIVALLLVLLVGASRIYLGVHYPTDVVAGYVAGLLWLTVAITCLETYRKGKPGTGRQGSELRD